MCSINHDLKLIFIHTPKCGGLYLQHVLETFYNFKTYFFTHEHHREFTNTNAPQTILNISLQDPQMIPGLLTITHQGLLRYFITSAIHNEHTGMNNEKWNSYTKFAVIRNPYDRIVSSYKYITKNKPDSLSFDEFIEKHESVDSYTYFHSFVTQYNNLLNDENKLALNISYLRFENLNEDLCNFLLTHGVLKIAHRLILLNGVKINKTADKNYIHNYNLKTLQWVTQWFKSDFEHFNIPIAQTMEELTVQSKTYYKNEDQFSKENVQLLIRLDEMNAIVKLSEIMQENVEPADEPADEPATKLSTSIMLDNGQSITVQPHDQRPKKKKFNFNVFMKLIEKMGVNVEHDVKNPNK